LTNHLVHIGEEEMRTNSPATVRELADELRPRMAAQGNEGQPQREGGEREGPRHGRGEVREVAAGRGRRHGRAPFLWRAPAADWDRARPGESEEGGEEREAGLREKGIGAREQALLLATPWRAAAVCAGQKGRGGAAGGRCARERRRRVACSLPDDAGPGGLHVTHG
jgi:hypothetical protein